MHLSPELSGIELHVHLDGSLRADTLWDLAKQRQIKLPHSNFEEFRRTFSPQNPYSLTKFLSGFQWVIPILAGDKEALVRSAMEFVEDCRYRSGLCYVEARFAPHLLTGFSMDAEAVIQATLDGLQRASTEHVVQTRLILCIMRDRPETADEVLQLARKYEPHGVVGIDIAGDESHWTPQDLAPELLKIFDMAKVYGVHRTVHAGEAGPAEAVHEAVFRLHAERVGHGYGVLKNPIIYEQVREAGVHFEVCPTSSIMTGAVKQNTTKKHPVHRFISDGTSFSLNTDDPLITGRWLKDELAYCETELGLSTMAIEQSKRNAVKAAFIDSVEDRELLLNHVLRKQ
ncbi:adenosine deaminase [Paragonimus westermani]|uniref:Adenosine deaminase n=1 Tax=Paragonimus westermani TaxID=34504 RepID=A0A5J4NWU3_9TREM|nr:adenosine deaminase [Paragonimus westermani]